MLRGSGLTVDQSRELWKAVKDCDRPELPAMSVRILQLLGDYPPTKSGGQSHIHFGFGPVITLETAIDLNDAPRARYRQVKGALTKGARLSAYTPLLLAGQEALVS